MAPPAGFEPATHDEKRRRDVQLSAPPAGFEPATHGLEVRRSVQLSYGGVREKVVIRACRAGALSFDSLGGRSSARLERQVVALEVGGSSPLGHPNAPSLPSRKSGLVTSGPLRL